MIRHRCFGRSISRKLAAAVMAVSLLAGQMLPVMAAEDTGDAASVKSDGASDTEKRSLSGCAAGKSTLTRVVGMKTKPWNWTMEQLYLVRIPWWRISRTGITRIMV